ncbi:hypothetical protein A9Q90_02370 [Gammaproteobacteria bacterium 54_18_T64]|nr:hypothetical protein A9Q90_02370 [Gammaproteobacteria bacterium 54_18_T64]
MGKRKRSKRVQSSLYAPYLWPSWLAVGLSWLLAKLPGSLRQSLSRGLAHLLIKTNVSRTNIIRRNIGLCFPNLSSQQQVKLAKQNLDSTIQLFFDLLDLVWARPESIDQRFDLSGENHYRQALDSDKPLILLTGHFSTFLIGLARLSHIHPLHVVYRRMDNPVLESQLYQRAVRQFPVTTIHRTETRRLVRKLQNKEVVLILPDQDFGKKRSVFISFFGIQTATITALPQYAKLAGANVLAYHTYRKDGGRLGLDIEPVFENFPSGDLLADTQRWSDWLEQSVRQHPEDYFWLHKRFKTRPAGEEKIY